LDQYEYGTMTPNGPRVIGLLVEAKADAETVRELVDRLLQHDANWISPELLHTLRAWRGFEPDTEVSLWKHVRDLCVTHGIRAQGHFEGEPGAPDALASRRALMLFRKLGQPDAIVLVRDADNQHERRMGLQQGRDEARHGVDPRCVAIGVAIPEREAWHLAGFIPTNVEEQQRLAEERQRLGFDPTLHPHRLRGNAKRNAKPVLDKLTAGNHERERQCLTDLPLDDPRCEDCGLTSFLAELRERVVTVIV
jgi:hypothetical protein